MATSIPCPECGGKLQYLIAYDKYRCSYCREWHEVLEVENDHPLYHGPLPPKDEPR